MTELTKQDLDNLMALIARASITGEQAAAVVNLQIKLQKMIQELAKPVEPPPTT